MKGIIVIEIPERCSNCLMRSITHGGVSVCQLKERKVNTKEKNRPDWCPIKEVDDKEQFKKWKLERGFF